MLDRIEPSATVRIGTMVAEVLSKHGVDGPVAPEAELVRHGLTSIDMVELMLGVEAEFDISIPPAEVTLANFRSIATIADMMTRLTASA